MPLGQPPRGFFFSAFYGASAALVEKRRTRLSYVTHSSNLVGYTSVTVKPLKYVALGIQFEKLDGTQAISINDIVAKTGLTSDLGWGSGMDQIWVMDTKVNQWAFYGYKKESLFSTNASWMKCTDLSGTGTFATLTADDVVSPGDTILFLHANNGKDLDLSLSGAVKPFTASASYTVGSLKYQFVAYPWPVEFKLADLPNYLTNAAMDLGWGSGMEQIWVMNPDPTANKWDFYGYVKDSLFSTTGKIKKCTDTTGTGTFESDATTDTIPAGQGFLILHANNGKDLGIEFTYPTAE